MKTQKEVAYQILVKFIDSLYTVTVLEPEKHSMSVRDCDVILRTLIEDQHPMYREYLSDIFWEIDGKTIVYCWQQYLRKNLLQDAFSFFVKHAFSSDAECAELIKMYQQELVIRSMPEEVIIEEDPRDKRIRELEKQVKFLMSGKKVVYDDITPRLNRKIKYVHANKKDYDTLQEYFEDAGITELELPSDNLVRIINANIRKFPDRDYTYITNNSTRIILYLE